MLGMTFWLRKAFKAYDTLSPSKVIPTIEGRRNPTNSRFLNFHNGIFHKNRNNFGEIFKARYPTKIRPIN